jgi:pyruvate ferredoxin oxidoreductase delta subunit
MCWLYCPEAAITIDDDGMYGFDLFYCKGCGICAEECPKKCITMVVEEEV